MPRQRDQQPAAGGRRLPVEPKGIPPTDPPATSPVDLRIAASPLVRLSTPDVRALRQRPLAEGVSASTITQPDHTRADDIEVIDADLHRIVVGQPGPVVAPTTCQPYGWHVDWAEAPVEQLAARP